MRGLFPVSKFDPTVSRRHSQSRFPQSSFLAVESFPPHRARFDTFETAVSQHLFDDDLVSHPHGYNLSEDLLQSGLGAPTGLDRQRLPHSRCPGPPCPPQWRRSRALEPHEIGGHRRLREPHLANRAARYLPDSGSRTFRLLVSSHSSTQPFTTTAFATTTQLSLAVTAPRRPPSRLSAIVRRGVRPDSCSRMQLSMVFGNCPARGPLGGSFRGRQRLTSVSS